MADFGPLFATTNPPEERKLARKVEKPEADDSMMIDGKPVRINWLSSEGKTGRGEYYEAGISFNATDHSVWRIRRNPDGSWEPIRCKLYGRQNLSEDELKLARKYTRQP